MTLAQDDDGRRRIAPHRPSPSSPPTPPPSPPSASSPKSSLSQLSGGRVPARSTCRSDFDWDAQQGSKNRSQRSSCADYDLSADLTELRAKFEQRRASECDDQNTILTATQIASMLEGDVHSLAESLTAEQRMADLRPRESSMQKLRRRAWEVLDRRAVKHWRLFVSQGYMLEAISLPVILWDLLLSAAALYNAIYVPLALALPAARWGRGGDDAVLDACLDALFILDVLFRFRVSYREHGYPVYAPKRVAWHYLKGWLLIDAVGALPFDLMVGQRGLALIKVLRMCRWRNLRKLDRLAGTSWMRIVQVELLFLLVAHYFGLAYYRVAIVPFIDQEVALADDDPSGQKLWIFVPENEPLVDGSVVANEYVCALYWALAAMTNLKGLPAHESRQCFELSSEVLNPLGERTLTIFCFLFGAMLYASIYGNIGSFLQTLDSSGLRYRKRMAEMNEFFNYHSIPAELQQRVRNYVEFQFSVTKGIDVEGFNNELPAHLQLELFLHLNRRMVEQVPLFNGMPSTFIKSIVMKLRPAVCIAGDHLFCAGDPMDAMYFVKRGYLHVIRNKRVLRSVREGSFLGEMALIRSTSVRTVDVRSVTDAILLALDCGSFDVVVQAHPGAQVHNVLKRNAYTRYNVRLSDETAEEFMPADRRRSSAIRKLSCAVHSITAFRRSRTSSFDEGASISELNPSPDPHPSDMAYAAAEAIKGREGSQKRRLFEAITGPRRNSVSSSFRGPARSGRRRSTLLVWKRSNAQVSPTRFSQRSRSDEGPVSRTKEDEKEQRAKGATTRKRGSVMGGMAVPVAGRESRRSGVFEASRRRRSSGSDGSASPRSDSPQQMSWLGSLGLRRSSEDRSDRRRPSEEVTSQPSTDAPTERTKATGSSSSSSAGAPASSAAGGSGTPSFGRRDSIPAGGLGYRRDSIPGGYSAVPGGGSPKEATFSLKKKVKGRATLAETWALSGKEAMALALSQGRFDRQMERHTDGLREELQQAIAASEQRTLGEIARMLNAFQAGTPLPAPPPPPPDPNAARVIGATSESETT